MTRLVPVEEALARPPDGRVFYRGEEVPRLALHDGNSELPFDLAIALVEAVRANRAVHIEVYCARSAVMTRPKKLWRIEVLEPGVPTQLMRCTTDEFLPTLDRLGLYLMPTEAPEGCRCRSYFLRTGLHAGDRFGVICPLANSERSGVVPM